MDAVPVSAGSETTLSADGRVLVPSVVREWAMLVPFGETRINYAFVEDPGDGRTTEVRTVNAAPPGGKAP
jgi:hypothetical protein